MKKQNENPVKKTEKLEKLFLPIASLAISASEYVVFKILLRETAVTAKEISDSANYSVRDIQGALNDMMKKGLVVRKKLRYTKAPIYFLNRSTVLA